MNPFPVTRNAFWLFGKHLTEDEEAAEWEGVLKCKETSKLLMELRCRGVWKAHPPLLGAGKKEMEPWKLRSGNKEKKKKKRPGKEIIR